MTRRRGALAATRLESLDPEGVGREVALRVIEHAEDLIALLGPDFALKRGRQPSRLERQLASVVRYAQTGEDLEGGHAFLDALLPLRTTATGATQDVEDADVLASDWNLALVGAHARAKLAKNQPVTARDLATLASITTSAVHGFTRAGELIPIKDGRPALYDSRQARRWLTERGVQGLALSRRA